MARVMPSQVVRTIDELFSHAVRDLPNLQLYAGQSSALLGILNLLKDIPDELITLSPSDYSQLVVARSAIEQHLAHWRARGNVGEMTPIMGFDTVTLIRRALAKCPDEHPPAATTELLFIGDAALRENTGRDLGTANRALNNAEWKSATVLARAAIEALLHWRLQEPSPGAAAVRSAVKALAASRKMSDPGVDIDRWDLHHFIEVAASLGLLKQDTYSAAKLAQNFRNLIHPGRAIRLAQSCDRATALSAVAALEHVIRDLN